MNILLNHKRILKLFSLHFGELLNQKHSLIIINESFIRYQAQTQTHFPICSSKFDFIIQGNTVRNNANPHRKQ